MQLPRNVVIGHDVYGQIPAVCADLKLGSSALLISGKWTMELAGERVRGIPAARHAVKTFSAVTISPAVIEAAAAAAAGA
ncbi:MAG: NAD(P)-dependent glycerol-1-phosphate dehydrogenase, partial [Methanoregula sp.]